MVTRAEEVNQETTSPCRLPHQFTWLATLVWRPPRCRQCAHTCRFHRGRICVWNINRHPSYEWPFWVFLLYLDVPGQATRPNPMPHVQFRDSWIKKEKEKKTHKKVKVGCLYKSQQAFKSCIVLLFVLGRSSLPFGIASGLKQRLSLLFVSLKQPSLFATICCPHRFLQQRSYPAWPLTALLRICWKLFWRNLLQGLNTHMLLHASKRLQAALASAAAAATLRYGNYGWFESALPQQFVCRVLFYIWS